MLNLEKGLDVMSNIVIQLIIPSIWNDHTTMLGDGIMVAISLAKVNFLKVIVIKKCLINACLTDSTTLKRCSKTLGVIPAPFSFNRLLVKKID